MKFLMALAVMLSTFAMVGVATTSPADAHFKKRHYHAKYYKAGKCKKHPLVPRAQEVPQALVILDSALTTDGAAPPGAALFFCATFRGDCSLAGARQCDITKT